MKRFVIKSNFRELIMGIVVYFLPAFLINLIPFLWLRMLSFAIFATAMVWLIVYAVSNSEDVVELKDNECLNKAFKTDCPNGVHIVGDYIKEQTQARTPVNMSDLDFPNSK